MCLVVVLRLFLLRILAFFHKCKFLKIVNVETSFSLVTKFEQSKDVFYETFSKKLSSGEIKCINLLISHLLLFPSS